MLPFLIYALALVACALYLPPVYFQPGAREFVLLLGGLSLWRYSWSLTHFTRSLIYRKHVFPRWRKQAEAMGDSGNPEHVFFLLTTFRIGTDVTIEVYREAIREAIRSPVPATIIASIVEISEENIVRALFRSQQPPDHVQLKIVRIAGTGKRDALAAGFRAVASTPVNHHRAVVSVIDGDSILTPGSTEACFRFFALNPLLGALTTDEDCKLEGNQKSIHWYRRWYQLRFAQRHVYMSSFGLARRVLTLTGRMSMFRANLIIEPEFIDTVQRDYIEHWRLGRFNFLTGDDKSSWYYLLKNGWEMWYIPDVQIITVEEPPHPNFFTGATVLMRRWFGNMLRTNSRALKVQRNKMGFFTWWCLIDQRLSMWTSLFGLGSVAIASLKYGPGLWAVSIWWVALIRYLQTLMLASTGRKLHISWPLLIYFNQIYGSIVKVYILNHLYKQKWTRQKTTLKSQGKRWDAWYKAASSNLSLAFYIVCFITFILFMTGVYDSRDLFRTLTNAQQWINFPFS